MKHVKTFENDNIGFNGTIYFITNSYDIKPW